jgi:hypothetical protein
MPASKRFPLFIATITVVLIVTGCGGGNNLSFPPPQGTFTNANFSGAFAFSYTGTDGAGFLAVAGSFQADGNGHITSGNQDINSGQLNAPVSVAVSGTYKVLADGRGSITLNSTAGNTTLDFVIVASGHALLTRFDASATGSGTIDQQTSSAFSNAALAGAFAISVSGIDSAGLPLAIAGNFTADNAGTLTTGIDDSNDNGLIVTSDPMSGSIPVTSTGRGTATLNTVNGALSFAYYVVDANHIKLVGTTALPALGGEAFRQTGPFNNGSVSGPFAFTIAGADVLNGTPFAAGGVLTSDGAGNISGGVEDFNDGGATTTNATFSGTYTMAPNGRSTMNLNTSAGAFSFVIYPSSGGVLVLETDARFVTSGSALQQQTAAFSNAALSGTYGLNFTGAIPNSNSELDSIAEFTADGAGKVSGIIDLNNSGGITFGQPLSGTFSIAANGRTTMTLQTSLGTQNLAVYLVNGTRAVFIELDTGLVAAGDIRHQ